MTTQSQHRESLAELRAHLLGLQSEYQHGLELAWYGNEGPRVIAGHQASVDRMRAQLAALDALMAEAEQAKRNQRCDWCTCPRDHGDGEGAEPAGGGGNG